jgi:uncharacterized membrane protein YdjX (TVP38/TMEM64 family)
MQFNLTPWKTYLAAGAIIVHQGLKLAGIDVPQQEFSDLIDAGLGAAAIVFRIMGYVQAKAAVVQALYTPVPTVPPPQ